MAISALLKARFAQAAFFVTRQGRAVLRLHEAAAEGAQ
jgi:hypothetical protein